MPKLSINPCAHGFIEDFERLIYAFCEKKSTQWSVFEETLLEENFDKIFDFRLNDRECREFTEECMRVVTLFLLPPCLPEVRICALFTLYLLHTTHPFPSPVLIRLMMKQWDEINSFMTQIKQLNNIINAVIPANQSDHSNNDNTNNNDNNNNKTNNNNNSNDDNNNIGNNDSMSSHNSVDNEDNSNNNNNNNRLSIDNDNDSNSLDSVVRIVPIINIKKSTQEEQQQQTINQQQCIQNNNNQIQSTSQQQHMAQLNQQDTYNTLSEQHYINMLQQKIQDHLQQQQNNNNNINNNNNNNNDNNNNNNDNNNNNNNNPLIQTYDDVLNIFNLLKELQAITICPDALTHISWKGDADDDDEGSDFIDKRGCVIEKIVNQDVVKSLTQLREQRRQLKDKLTLKPESLTISNDVDSLTNRIQELIKSHEDRKKTLLNKTHKKAKDEEDFGSNSEDEDDEDGRAIGGRRNKILKKAAAIAPPSERFFEKKPRRATKRNKEPKSAEKQKKQKTKKRSKEPKSTEKQKKQKTKN